MRRKALELEMDRKMDPVTYKEVCDELKDVERAIQAFDRPHAFEDDEDIRG